MKVLVYARRINADAKSALAENLQAEGHYVVQSNSKYYRGEVDKEADLVFHDGMVPEIADRYKDAGIKVQSFAGSSSRPATHRTGDLPEGYFIEGNAPWFTLYGPDGEKVGKAKRSWEEAAAQVPEAGD